MKIEEKRYNSCPLVSDGLRSYKRTTLEVTRENEKSYLSELSHFLDERESNYENEVAQEEKSMTKEIQR